MGDFERIKSVVDRVVSRLESGGAAEFRSLWEKSVDADSFKHSVPVSFKGERLTVMVDNSVYMQNLILRREEIRERINLLSPGRKVSEIKFRMGCAEK